MIGCHENLGGIFDDLTCSYSVFQRVEIATEKARVPVWVLNLGTDNKWKPNERSSLSLDGREVVWKIDTKDPRKNEFDRQWYRVWKWCEIEKEASAEKPYLSCSEYSAVLQYP